MQHFVKVLNKSIKLSAGDKIHPLVVCLNIYLYLLQLSFQNKTLTDSSTCIYRMKIGQVVPFFVK